MIKMIAGLGGHLGRKHDSEPSPQDMWIDIQRMQNFALACEMFQGVIDE